mmetsp:Transcript_23207/g.30989  ORF Transcript_23207/g.30989 Transcript_23207/m.30989 type:complete len:376 (-) Transcript_23207:1065-2192(-)
MMNDDAMKSGDAHDPLLPVPAPVKLNMSDSSRLITSSGGVPKDGHSASPMQEIEETDEKISDNFNKTRPAASSSINGGESVKISFSNVQFSVTVRASRDQQRNGEPAEKTLNILKDVTGFCLPSQTTFIMGASGAGKTSLLNLLSDRVGIKPGMTVRGKIAFNDVHTLNQQLFSNYATYVMQDDVIFAYFTVKEALTFAARLKLKCSEEEQDRRVDELIGDLGLEQCKDTQVGSILKKLISGGERKRTAIGVELITDPKCVLLDEPTSGLDSFTAVKIVKCLQTLARRRNKTIVSTIHQPSSEAYAYCDRLILLADGHIVYQGDAQKVSSYFDMANKCKSKNRNPCDYFMREMSINYPKKTEDDEKIAHYTKKYE